MTNDELLDAIYEDAGYQVSGVWELVEKALKDGYLAADNGEPELTFDEWLKRE